MSGEGFYGGQGPPVSGPGYYVPQGRKTGDYSTPGLSIAPDYLSFDPHRPGFEVHAVPTKRTKPKPDHSARVTPLPTALEDSGPSSNIFYQAALADLTRTFSPQILGFLPSTYWLSGNVAFGDLVVRFFQRKNNANCRFPHKLFNALLLVEASASLWYFVGVQWVNDRVFKVDKWIFGRVLGIGAIDGGLFHRQGNFPSHGFAELSTNESAEIKRRFGLDEVDGDRVRLMHHPMGLFARGGKEESINKCKWGTE
jgi:hypothetical protein